MGTWASPFLLRARTSMLRRAWLRSALRPVSRELRPQRWIFIVGCYNSGTTLLARLLSQHPQITGLPMEGVALTSYLPRPEEHGWPRMWSQCIDDVRLLPGAGMQQTAKSIQRDWSLAYPRSAENLLEKSIANSARMEFLDAYFRPAYFIHIVRNGFAASEGIRRRARPGQWHNPRYADAYPIELCAQQWQRTEQVIAASSQQVERVTQVYYEDLAQRPDDIVEGIVEFLGLRSVSLDLGSSNVRVDGNTGQISDFNRASLSRLNEHERSIIESNAGDQLRRHHYL